MHLRIIGAEIVYLHRKFNGLLFTRSKCDPFESFQLPHRPRSRRHPIVHVELHNFSTFAFARVLNIGGYT